MNSFFYLLFLAFTIAGCSSEPEKKDVGRIAATVNGVEITQREVTTLYERSATPGVSEEVRRNQERAILAGLVRGELLAQKAVAEKLDRTPEFLIILPKLVVRCLQGWLKSLCLPLSSHSLIKRYRLLLNKIPLFLVNVSCLSMSRF